ncbi:MAG: aminotransferase class V-fold PLP-dependent enzyme [Ruminococcus sp.]|nr:aminotransferase class V-fold PLP-dependent enzyme [Ruminococcus sp.]
MDTPIIDFLDRYASSGALRCHMPGHKGDTRFFPRPEWDITEISGADALFEAQGIIAESERNMSRLYGTAATVYSAGGSTLCIQAMLAIMKREGRRVLAVRNAHRAFLNAAALTDIRLDWLMPVRRDGILSGTVSPAAAEAALSGFGEDQSCLYVTSPDYTGRTADIPALAEVCRRHGARLIVDNAHGAHLAFMPENIHPIALGADMCCDSAHKMLPALTGAAMLHTSREEYAPLLKPAMAMFGSTSPSYLIMASLDGCCRYIADEIRGDIADSLRYARVFRESFAGRLAFAEGDPFHVTVRASESGYNGDELAQLLRDEGCECEYSDSGLLILLMSPVNRREDWERLGPAMEKVLGRAENHQPFSWECETFLPERAMTVREAVFAPSEDIPVDEAEGRICGAVNVPCPPAVPIAASGEVIDRRCINIFKRYGIFTVNVVK